MRGTVLRGTLCLGAAVVMFALSGCARSAPAAQSSAAAAGTPVYDAWTTPPVPGATYSAQPANASALQPAPRAISQSGGETPYVSPQYVAPSYAGAPGAAAYPGGALPPPPPPDGRYPVVGVPTTPAPVATGASAFPTPSAQGSISASDPRVPAGARSVWMAPERTYTCGLPCRDGISQWHLRGVVGLVDCTGSDSSDPCSYWGADIGRTFCGCWSWDVFYRYTSGRFLREVAPGTTYRDGGEWHFFGTKVAIERQIARSQIYWWAGVGLSYYTTREYLNNDSGISPYGEAGLGWNLGRQWRLRAGVNVHGADTDVTRTQPANDGRSRWLWLVAPVVEAEFSF